MRLEHCFAVFWVLFNCIFQISEMIKNHNTGIYTKKQSLAHTLFRDKK